MKKSFRILSLLATGLAVVGCQDFDNGFSSEDIKKAEYAKNFEKTFGKVDPNQDWSMATLVKANVNLPGISGTAKMNICTGDPRNPETRLLAQLMLKDGQGSIDFDAIKGNNNVFVTVEQDGQYKLYSSYPIINGTLSIGEDKNLTRAGSQVSEFAGTCPTTKDGDLLEINVSFEPLATGGGSGSSSDPVAKVLYITSTLNQSNGQKKTIEEWKTYAQNKMDSYGASISNFAYNDGDQPFKKEAICTYDGYGNITGLDFHDLTPENTDIEHIGNYLKDGCTAAMETPAGGSGGSTPTTQKVKIQYLNNVENVAAKPWAFGWGYSLFGKNAIFQERIRYFLPYKHDANGSPEQEFNKNEVYQKYGVLYNRDDLDKLEKGFAITTTGGTIEMPYIYGATQTKNQFGYVYWQDGEDPLTKPHYILMDDATPNNNIYWDEWGIERNLVGDMSLSNFYSYESALAAKNDGIRHCECQVGNGKWSLAHGDHELAEHADYCQTTDRTLLLDNPTCTCDCNKRGTGIYSSETATHTANCVDYFDDYLAAYNKLVYGSKYRLMYFGENGENTTGSYVFPSDKTFHIAFFISPRTAALGHDNTGHRLGLNYNYSLPELNRRIGNLYWYEESPSYVTGNHVVGDPNERGNVKAISWTQTITNLDGTEETVTLLGFGDNSGDNDLNDIIFMVKGNYTPTTPQFEAAPIKWHMNYDPNKHTDTDLYFEENKSVGKPYSQPATFPTRDGYIFMGWAETAKGAPIANSNNSQAIKDIETPSGGKCYYAIWEPVVTPGPDPEPISWIFACEDLGGSFDYDFNDVVWEVKKIYADGVCTGAQVSVLAAGGTLPFTLKYNGTAICTKTEAFDDIVDTDVVNADAPNGKTRTPKTFTVADIGADWNVSDNYTKFSVDVNGGTGTYHIEAYSKTTKPGDTPQVILLPGEWEWPTESTPINTAYTNFNTWVTDYKAAPWSEWQKHKQGATVHRQ